MPVRPLAAEAPADQHASGSSRLALGATKQIFTVITWNACGLGIDAVNDLVSQLADTHFDALMIQEGPKAIVDTYKILAGGHALFLGNCGTSARSVGVLLHKRWLDKAAKTAFTSLGARVASLSVDCSTLRLSLITGHMPHAAYADEEYEAALMRIEEAVHDARRSRRTSIVGIDANGVLGTRVPTDSDRIIGE